MCREPTRKRNQAAMNRRTPDKMTNVFRDTQSRATVNHPLYVYQNNDCSGESFPTLIANQSPGLPRLHPSSCIPLTAFDNVNVLLIVIGS